MKSTNMISTSGRQPLMARPTAMPANPISEIGVSRTRHSPKRWNRRRLAPKVPPEYPMSSPRNTIPGSLSISIPIVSAINWEMFIRLPAGAFVPSSFMPVPPRTHP